MASKAARPQEDSTDSSRSDAHDGAAAALLAQRQLAAAADWMANLFRAGERLQQTQVQMAQRAALLHSQAADNLRKATSPADLLTIQSTLALYQCQEGMRFWQEMLLESAKVGRMAAERMQEARPAATAAEGSAAPPDPMEAAAPILQAWQQVFNGAMHAASPTTH